MPDTINFEELVPRLEKREQFETIKKAYLYAYNEHKGMKRLTKDDFITHPLEVTKILMDLNVDDTTIIASLLHEVINNGNKTYEDLVNDFGEDIAKIVLSVSKINKLELPDNNESSVIYLRKILVGLAEDVRVLYIKLADRLHNMRTLSYLPRNRQIANAKETMDLYAPLANRLGIYSLKWELEDLSFRYLYPEEYRELVAGIEKKREERLEFIDKIMEEIKVALKKEDIKAEITGRAKHLYSIYRKMKRDNITLDQVYDLFALRIIVNSVKDCYAALGVVHELYSPMPGRFKDYIAVPKPNMYQSIHTTLIGPNGTPFEVQVRTWDMHRIAEFGIAAHWAYKEANNKTGKKSNVVVTEDKLAWLRETLEWQKDMQDPDEFLNTLKTELFEDEVYVFTPKGKIIALPKGSTPIDFAYYIHAEIGNHMTGAKINSKMMPIVTKLKNGDIVEIITSDQSKGPSRDWLKFVKSSTAKNKILAWYKKNDREENIVKGKDLIEKEIKKIGMTHAEIAKSEYIQAALDRYKYSEVDEMYASVGFGAISAGKVVARMLEEYRKDHQTENLEEKLEVLSKDRAYKPKATKTGIVVKGIDNCLVKLSKCCNPVPGDEIVGYITKGRGVSVHRKDCVNVNNLLSEENRMIDVYWYEAEKTRYSVDIEVYGNERSGLLADIIREIEGTKSKLLAVTSRANKEKISITEVTVEVENIEELNKILKQIRKVDSVYEVKRKK